MIKKATDKEKIVIALIILALLLMTLYLFKFNDTNIPISKPKTIEEKTFNGEYEGSFKDSHLDGTLYKFRDKEDSKIIYIFKDNQTNSVRVVGGN